MVESERPEIVCCPMNFTLVGFHCLLCGFLGLSSYKGFTAFLNREVPPPQKVIFQYPTAAYAFHLLSVLKVGSSIKVCLREITYPEPGYFQFYSTVNLLC